MVEPEISSCSEASDQDFVPVYKGGIVVKVTGMAAGWRHFGGVWFYWVVKKLHLDTVLMSVFLRFEITT